MTTLPLTALATLAAIAVYFWTLFLVGRARGQYGVPAPRMSGDERFERCFRVQMNTVEQLLLMLPALWLCAFWVGDLFAAIGGLVWCAGRILYAISYQANPAKRGFGFMLTITPTFVMAVAVTIRIVMSFLA